MSPTKTDYKSTLNLPKTEFAMKADLPKREPEILKRWEAMHLYEAIQQARQGSPKYVLHDGPPYANGDIHIGHALNKILKDLIVRYKTMRGYAAPYVPGWDCHGMPIEHQLFKELKRTKHQIRQADFRAKARAYAQKYVDIQREQFKRLGVLGEWEHPYLTMSKDYELAILRVFKELVKAGCIYRGKKPVYWCATCETALAEAEVEYADRQDQSIYVKCELEPASVAKIFNGSRALPGIKRVSFVIWTTTPWTLPANVAVALRPDASYRVVQANAEEAWIVADQLVTTFLEVTGTAGPRLCVIAGQDFAALQARYVRPFAAALGQAVADEFVSMEEGTGVVHIAPGHGHEDYVLGQRYKLDVLSPVDHQGRFTNDVPEFIAGQSVFEANSKIVADLKKRGLLLKEDVITHSYPHCWRCKQPVIFRATPQWFLRVDDALRAKLLEVVKHVRWIPDVGASRMRGMLENRPDWCLSRQRYWGSPIPVFHCTKCEQPLVTPDVIERTIEALAKRGVEAWFTDSPEQLVPGMACSCGNRELQKDPDILDVWFDSGVSHEAVLRPRQDTDLKWPASLYLEGSDQHRGWFQVSLIPSVALHGQPPYEQVLTHGFVMDGEGRKMSKSLGNVIAPQEVIERDGAEILRLWVASSDYSEDVRISEDILGHVAESYRKIRNTFRYLLANLYDFDPHRDAQPPESLLELDRWALHRTQRLLEGVTQACEAYQFHQASRAVYQFCVLDLSAFYLDAVKDRLYTEAAGSAKRRCAQTALYAILSILVRALAPVLAMTSEEVWQQMRALKLVDGPSVHLASWPERVVEPVDNDLMGRWETLLSVRALVMKALEEQREADVIGSPLEARVTVVVTDDALKQRLESHREALAEACIVSELDVEKDARVASGLDVGRAVPGLAHVKVERAPGAKCPRCWKYTRTVGTHAEHPQLCARCAAVVTGRGR